ncbi:hypothetical protein CcaCcLH18_13648 [Colletotrichum camelliae]|nr:hypothetical protein CcaCcLH18_13648 [Colletotrichum camelliae]
MLSLKASPQIPESSGFNEAEYKNLGVVIHLAGIAQHDEQRFDAAECIVAWAAIHISETVFQNKSGSTLVQKGIAPALFTQNRTSTEDNKDMIFVAPCSGKKNNDTCHFKVTSDAHLAVRRLLTNFTTGYVYRDIDSTNNGTLFIPSNPIMDLFAWSWRKNLARISTFPNPLNKTLDDYMFNTAWALSGYIRNREATQLEGQNGCFEPVFHIEWRYTIHPGVMLILTLYLLAFTVRSTRDMPVWKSSLLPFLYHGFDHPILNSGYDLSTLPRMEGLSKEKRVVLRDAGDGLGFKLRDMERGTDDEGV